MTREKIKLLQKLLEEAANTLEKQGDKALEEKKTSKAHAFYEKATLLDRTYNITNYIKEEELKK